MIKANSDAAFRNLIGAFMRFYHKTLFNSHWGESVSFQADNALMLNMAFQGLDQPQAEVAWKPFLDFVTGSPQDFVFVEAPKINAIPARHYWDPEYRKRVLPKSVVADNRVWGPNYPRLQAVKTKYDPVGLFFVHHGVGSEEWSADGFTRLK